MKCASGARRAVVGAWALGAALAACPATKNAAAHAALIASQPANGVSLAQAPTEVRLRLTEAVSERMSSARLLDAEGRAVEADGIALSRPEPDLLVLALPRLPDGVYSVLWKALSEADGHFTRGLVAFGVGTPAPAGGAAPLAAERPGALEVASRWLGLGLQVMIIGAVAVAALVLGPRRGSPALAEERRRARHRVLAWAVLCGLLAPPAGLALLAAQAQGAAGPGAGFWSSAWRLVAGTRWGALWLTHEALLAATCMALLWLLAGTRPAPPRRAEGGRLPWLAAFALTAALAAVQACGSHAAGLGREAAPATAADAVHILAAGLWAGGVCALAVGLLPAMWRDRSGLPALAREAWTRFSALAAVAVGLVVATGLFALGAQVASLDGLVASSYGRALLVKLALVAAMGAVGLVNFALLHPDLAARALPRRRGRPASVRSPAGGRPLGRLIPLDVALAVLVLLATGLITADTPPRGAEFSIAAEDVHGEQSRRVGDLWVTLSVNPNHPGTNALTVFAASARRPPPAEIMRVILRFAYRGEDLGRTAAVAREVEPGRFVVSGGGLALAGPWRIDVVVRRRGLQDAVARFDWLVAPSGGAAATILSKASLRTPTRVAAGLGLVIVIVLAGVARWGRARLRRRSGAAGGAARRPDAADGEAAA